MAEKGNNKNLVVFGIYKTREAAERAVDVLRADGFRASDVSVLLANSATTREFAHEKQTKAPEGATIGAGTGAAIGGSLGWLAGIGALAIPGVGPFIAAGPIMAALAGIGVGGALGGLSGAMIGVGIPEYEAKRYEGFVKEGGILLSVHSDDRVWSKKAEEILKATGADNISTTGESSADIKEPEKSSSVRDPNRITAKTL